MTKRLQVLLDDEELAEIQQIARRRRMTTAEWVRRSLREARAADPGSDASTKLVALRRAMRHAYPVADVDVLLAEIERGYLGTDPRP